MRLHWRDFYFVGLSLITDRNIDRGATPTDHQERQFRSQFGISWFICEDIWNMLDQHKFNRNREPKHLLWALLFVKVYGNEATHCKMVGTSPKTFRKWVWQTLTEIADFKAMIVSF